MKKLTVYATNQGIDLALIGVPISSHDKRPSVSSFPLKFNQLGRPIWIEMLNSDEYKAEAKTLTIEQAWHYAIKTFMKLASNQGLNPFDDILDRSDNNMIINFLSNQRRKIRKYMDGVDFFSIGSLSKPSRSYDSRNTGFILTSRCQLNPKISIFELQTLLQKNKWQRVLGPNIYQHVIDSTTRIFLRTITSSRCEVWYEIKVGGSVYYPNTHKIPTKQQMHKFISDNIWLPVVRSNKFQTLKRSLLF